MPALFLTRHAQIASTYFDVFSTAAKEYGVYLVAGSVVLPPYRLIEGRVRWEQGPLEARLYNTSYLFGPDGLVLGKQTKVHLIDLEQEAALHLDRGETEAISVIETPLGRIGMAICIDSFQEDVADALERGRTDILVQPSANPGPRSPEQQLDWLNSSYKRTVVEGRFAYGVNPMMTGAIWAPLSLWASFDRRRRSQRRQALGLLPAGANERLSLLADDDRSRRDPRGAGAPSPASRSPCSDGLTR